MPDATDDSPVYLRVAGKLRDEIRSGARPLGSRLPSAAELEADPELKIHKNTANKVLGVLKDEGFAVLRKGRGTFVTEQLPEEKLSDIEQVRADIAALSEQIRQLADRLAEHEAGGH